MWAYLPNLFSAIGSWENLLAIVAGVTFGIIVGATPGLTTSIGMAIALPLTFYMSPVAAISFLIGINKGGVYGGSVSAILLRTPGTLAAVTTVFDGYPLAQKGKAGKALKMAIDASVIGDGFSDLVLIFSAPLFASLALKMGPPEICVLMLFALTFVAGLSGRSLYKGFIAAALGFLFATVGIDPIVGTPRFTFGIFELRRGISLLPALIGLFAISEILIQGERKLVDLGKSVLRFSRNPDDNRVTLEDMKTCGMTILRSSIIGTFVGALPGLGSSVAAALSYGVARKMSKRPELFGKGSLEGVAACEAGNNATVGATYIPLLTLGIPGSVPAAVLLGGLMIQGITPGPLIFQKQAHLIYPIFGLMLVANLINLFLGNIGARFFLHIAKIPRRIIFPILTLVCITGVYTINNSLLDIKLMIVFGLLGYLLRKLDFPLLALLLGFILEPHFEVSLRQSLLMSGGNPTIFLVRPVSLILLICTILFVGLLGTSYGRKLGAAKGIKGS